MEKEQIMSQNLIEIKEVFDQASIKFWLDWGTLLGAIRDKQIIPWDNDTDVGVFDKEYDKIVGILPKLKRKGFLANEVPVPVPDDNLHKKFGFCRSGYCTDIYLYSIKEDKAISVLFAPDKGSFAMRLLWLMWCLLTTKEVNADPQRRLFLIRKTTIFSFIKFCLSLLPKRYLIKKIRKSLIKRIKKDKGQVLLQMVIVPKHHLETLDFLEFYGIKFNVPSNTEKYLEYKYGESWRTPDKKWDYRNDGAAEINFLK